MVHLLYVFIKSIHVYISAKYAFRLQSHSKPVCDMIKTKQSMHRTHKYSQNSSMHYPVWVDSGVFVSGLSGCAFVSRFRQF